MTDLDTRIETLEEVKSLAETFLGGHVMASDGPSDDSKANVFVTRLHDEIRTLKIKRQNERAEKSAWRQSSQSPRREKLIPEKTEQP